MPDSACNFGLFGSHQLGIVHPYVKLGLESVGVLVLLDQLLLDGPSQVEDDLFLLCHVWPRMGCQLLGNHEDASVLLLSRVLEQKE